jgi:hypothetical protein
MLAGGLAGCVIAPPYASAPASGNSVAPAVGLDIGIGGPGWHGSWHAPRAGPMVRRGTPTRLPGDGMEGALSRLERVAQPC